MSATRGPNTMATVDEDARRRFERAWHEGRPQSIEQFLPAADHPYYLPTLEELVLIELEFRWKNGKPAGRQRREAQVEAFLERFPDLDQPHIIDKLLRQEWKVREAAGDSPSAEEFRSRFPHWVHRQVPEHCEFLAPPQRDDELGRLGGYRVLKVLGSGGMGTVFLAEDLQLNRHVALKAMLPALAMNAAARQRFLREAQAAAAVKHDHIVTIHQVGEERGVPFLAMELLDGQSLHDRLKDKAALPVSEIIRIGSEVAAGLAAAHKRGLIHRDIKPANIWLETETGEPGASATGGRVTILDFGLARAATTEGVEVTQSGVIVGTPAYMSPEQAKASKLDARSDLFSLGCVLYRMSTGELPFKGRDALSVLMSVTTDNPPPPRQINPKIPKALSDLVMRLMAKGPEARPSSAAEVAQLLTRLSDTGSRLRTAGRRLAPVKAASSLEPESQPARHSGARWIAILALVVVGLVAVIGGIALVGAGGWLKSSSSSVVRGSDRESESQSSANESSGISSAAGGASSASTVDELVVPQPNGGPGEDDPSFPGLVSEPAKLPGVRRWQIETLAARESSTMGYMLQAAISPDGSMIACVGGDSQLRIFDWAKAQPLRIFPRDWTNGFVEMKWSADSSQLAVVSEDGHAQLYDVKHARIGRRIGPEGNGIRSISWSSFGARLASCDRDGAIRIWDAADGTQVHEFKPEDPRERPSLIAWRPRGGLLAIVNGKTIVTMNPDDGKRVDTVKMDFPVHDLTWNPSANLLAALCQDSKIRLWSPLDPAKVTTLDGPNNLARTHFAWRADGEQLIAMGVSKESKCHAETWSAPEGKLLSSEDTDRWLALSWPESGVHGVSQMCELVDYGAKGQALRKIPREQRGYYSLLWSADGEQIASGGYDGTIRIWNGKTGRPGPAFQEAENGAVQVHAWHPDGKRLCYYHRIGQFRLWTIGEADRGRLIDPANVPVGGACWADDGKSLIYTRFKQCLRWHIEDDSIDELFQETDFFDGVATKADGSSMVVRLAGKGSGSTTVLRIHSLPQGKLEAELSTSEGANLAAPLIWSPDGKRLAAHGLLAAEALVWEPPQPKPAGTVHPFCNGITALTWHPDSRQLTIGMCERPSNYAIFQGPFDGPEADAITIKHPGPHAISHLAWQPGTKDRLLSAADDHALRLWDMTRQKPLWTAVALGSGRAATIKRGGELTLSHPDAAKALVYIVERDDGTIELKTVEEFRALVKQR